jgi:hypothetical protein
MGERRSVYRVLVGMSKGKGLLGRPRRRWEDKIRCIFRKWDVGYGLDRADSEKGQVVRCCECGNEPSGSIKCGKFLE